MEQTNKAGVVGAGMMGAEIALCFAMPTTWAGRRVRAGLPTQNRGLCTGKGHSPVKGYPS